MQVAQYGTMAWMHEYGDGKTQKDRRQVIVTDLSNNTSGRAFALFQLLQLFHTTTRELRWRIDGCFIPYARRASEMQQRASTCEGEVAFEISRQEL
jgi:hypothetical protein